MALTDAQRRRRKRKERKTKYADLTKQAEKLGLEIDYGDLGEKQFKKRNQLLKQKIQEAQAAEKATEEETATEQESIAEVTPTSAAKDTTAAIGAVTPAVAQDVAAGIGFRGDVRDILAGEISAAGAEGLTQQDLADIDAVSQQRMRGATEDFRNRVQSVIGGLQGRGFTSSNLAGRNLQEGAYDPYSRNVQDIMTGEAQMRQNILNARAQRRAQRVQSALGAVGTLGTGGVTELQNTYIDPNRYGGMSQAQAAQIAIGAAGAGANYYSQAGKYGAGVLSENRVLGY